MLGVPKRKKKITKLFGMVAGNFLTVYVFARPGPRAKVITKYVHLKPFWPRTAPGTWRNSRRKTEERKTDTENGKPETGKQKNSHTQPHTAKHGPKREKRTPFQLGPNNQS